MIAQLPALHKAAEGIGVAGLRTNDKLRTFSPMPETAELLTVVEAAAALGIAPRTVLYRITHGHLAAEKHGTGLRAPYIITRTEIDRVLAQNAEKTPA